MRFGTVTGTQGSPSGGVAPRRRRGVRRRGVSRTVRSVGAEGSYAEEGYPGVGKPSPGPQQPGGNDRQHDRHRQGDVGRMTQPGCRGQPNRGCGQRQAHVEAERRRRGEVVGDVRGYETGTSLATDAPVGGQIRSGMGEKVQVKTGGPPGDRTRNPRIIRSSGGRPDVCRAMRSGRSSRCRLPSTSAWCHAWAPAWLPARLPQRCVPWLRFERGLDRSTAADRPSAGADSTGSCVSGS